MTKAFSTYLFTVFSAKAVLDLLLLLLCFYIPFVFRTLHIVIKPLNFSLVEGPS